MVAVIALQQADAPAVIDMVPDGALRQPRGIQIIDELEQQCCSFAGELVGTFVVVPILDELLQLFVCHGIILPDIVRLIKTAKWKSLLS